MHYRNNIPIAVNTWNIVMNGGGLGDCIGAVPAFKHIIDFHPEVSPRFLVPDFFKDLLMRSIGKVDKNRVRVFSFSEAHRINKNHPSRVFQSSQHTNLSCHVTDHAFNLFLNKGVDDWCKDYVPVDVSDVDVAKFNLPDKYIVLTVMFTSPVREWLPKHINKVIAHFKKLNLPVVVLGKKETPNGANFAIKGVVREEINFADTLNLIDQTSLLEATKIMYGSTMVVGLDNGLLHLAATHPTLPIVGGFTTLKPEHRMPYRNGGRLGYRYYPVVPPATLQCRGCQSNMVFEINHKAFTLCPYFPSGQGEQIKCLDQLDGDLFIKRIDEVMYDLELQSLG